MTAELVIMNKRAVAIAADSAVTTMSGKDNLKVFSSENKIFQLSRYEPIAIMIWDSIYFMNIPFETLIKNYRKDIINTKSFNNLNDYSNDFLTYLQKSKHISSEDQELKYINHQISEYMNFLIKKANDILFEKERNKENTELSKIYNEIITEEYLAFSNLKNIKTVDTNFIDKYKKIILRIGNDIQTNVFKGLKIETEKLLENLFSIFTKEGLSSYGYKLKTGIAICGYGNSEIFPTLNSFKVYGVLGNTLLYEDNINSSINHQNEAMIQPFAQSEMIDSFVTGIHPNYLHKYHQLLIYILISYPKLILNSVKELKEKEKSEYLDRILNSDDIEISDFIKRIIEESVNIGYELFFKDILSVISILPKDELANMAEVLINLTSFKRRLSFEAETVGGPIDVAVLSKGDGFIWVKRKHYFNRELNQQYFVNYERGYKNVQSRRKKTSDTE